MLGNLRFRHALLAVASIFTLALACGGSDDDGEEGSSDGGKKEAASEDGNGGSIWDGGDNPIEDATSGLQDGTPELNGQEAFPNEGYTFSTPTTGASDPGTTSAYLSFSLQDNAYKICNGKNSVKKETTILRLIFASPGQTLAVGNYAYTASSAVPYLHGELQEYDTNCKLQKKGSITAGNVTLVSQTATSLDVEIDVVYATGFVKRSYSIPVCKKSLKQVQEQPPPACF